ERADFTALDVDGDGYSISEYATFSNPANVAYSSFSSLATTPAGSLGSVLNCTVCGAASALSQCLVCHGTGDVLGIDCVVCDGSGVLFGGCSHAFDGVIGNVLQGPVQNFANIDTNATQVMATYQYKNVDKITFRYGAKSGAYASNGSGIRLNSLWSKSFDLTPWQTLPVSFSRFAVLYEKGDANISWQAPSSEMLSHFVVQRSTDGKNFTDIATVFPGKTTSYSYKDQGVAFATGVVYYRVVSVDFTKESQTSTVKMIRLNKSDAQTIVLATYPNPVVNDVRITLPNAWQGKPVMLQLYTSNGTIAKSMQLGSAGQTETMTLNGLTKGLYIVKAVCGEETAQQRVVKN
ncbi:MAG: T9SS type A sorting domain-containing protein, partial [Chitinophagaceae bacterium]